MHDSNTLNNMLSLRNVGKLPVSLKTIFVFNLNIYLSLKIFNSSSENDLRFFIFITI